MTEIIEDLAAVERWLRRTGWTVERVGPISLLVPSPLAGREAALLVTWGSDVVQLSQGIALVGAARRADVQAALAALNLRLAVPGFIIDPRDLVSYRLTLLLGDGGEGLAASALARALAVCRAGACAALPELDALAAVEHAHRRTCLAEVMAHLAS